MDSGCLKLSENIQFVWSERSYSGDKRGCHACGQRTTDNGRNVKIELEFWEAEFAIKKDMNLLCKGVRIGKAGKDELLPGKPFHLPLLFLSSLLHFDNNFGFLFEVLSTRMCPSAVSHSLWTAVTTSKQTTRARASASGLSSFIISIVGNTAFIQSFQSHYSFQVNFPCNFCHVKNICDSFLCFFRFIRFISL